MSAYRLPTFIVLEIPPPLSEAVQLLRNSLATPTSRLPVEITVAGSSGTGPIPAGTGKAETEAILKSVLSGLKPFSMQFQEIRRFPNTNIFYIAPQNRQPFDHIHGTLKASGITFAPGRWPYNPHCTLRSGPMNQHAPAGNIFNLPFPKQDFVVDTLSIYEFDPLSVTCHLSFQTRL
jgi:2'-5' RNA ligase